jgi:hypothetical protein
MGQLRWWSATLIVWLFAFGNIEQLYAPLSVSRVTYALSIGTALVYVLWPWLRLRSPFLTGVCLVTLLAVLKLAFGEPLLGAQLPVTVTEACAVVITLGLARQVAVRLDRVEHAAADALMMELDSRLAAFDVGQEDIYREIRRARQFERPLSLVAIAPTQESVQQSFHRFAEEVQRRAIEKYIYGRVADLLSRKTTSCDLIARRNNHFIVLLPETDQDRAEQVIERLARSVEEELGLKIRSGMATFPDEEITFTGLLERAEAGLHREEFELAPHQGNGAVPSTT